ncbi:unnamed protein product, partial [Phaeothamnion confervicola]
MIISVTVAIIVVGLATMNWMVVPFVAVCLVTTLLMTLAILVLVGWRINVVESISITIAAGLSVDYVVHILHAYQDVYGDRQIRIQGSLTKMGVSVTSGVLTTVGAVFVLLFCNLTWFAKFGELVC